ncbi:MAG: hypothetical protein KGO05_04285 [Chloroflexota bacterium]|nr:hypothetical protein [Chloroflexota bacterium]
MIAEGLLWFDDDTRRPLLAKIADAIERYGERTGWRATVCEAHPSQAEAALAEITRAANPARRRSPAKASAALIALPPHLRIRPNPSLRPNYFLVGVEAGERPRKAAPAQTSAQRRSTATPATRTAAASERRPRTTHAKAS